MNETFPTPSLQRTLTPEVAQRIIRSFEKRFGKPHLYLAYHAALPWTLTPDLLYSLWANFPCDVQGVKLAIPWIAVADLLLSSLCDEVGHELYEINVSVRHTLLEEMKTDVRFGPQRISELSDFLFAYIKEQLHSSDPDIRAFAQIQGLTVLAYSNFGPELAADKLSHELRFSLEKMDRAEQIRIASLIETFSNIFANTKNELSHLLKYSRHIARYAYNNENNAEAQHDTEDAAAQIKNILLRRLPALMQIEQVSGEVDLQSTSLDHAVTSQPEEYLAAVPITDIAQPITSSSPTTEPYTHSWYSPYTIEIYNKTPPKHRGTCPSCFEEISFEECRIISGKTSNTVLKAAPRNWWEQRVTNQPPEPLYTPAYRMEMARRECPLCQYLLPYNIECVKGTTLAIVGDTFSGKSHYIAALFHQIKNDWLPYVTDFTRFACLTPEVENSYINNLFEPLLIKKQVIQPTIPAVKRTLEPLIYELVIGSSITNLMIYDTSGEDFARADRIVQFARFIFSASAFLFVADPVRMTHIVRQLPPDLQTTLQPQFKLKQQRRVVDMVSSTLSLYERYRVYPKGGGIYPPIAIMISKADLLQSLTPQQYKFMRSPSYGNDVDLLDGAIVDREVRELLRKYGEGDLLGAIHNSKQNQFFANSATGTPPNTDGYYPFVKPYRCLDPLLWILYRLGMIKARI